MDIRVAGYVRVSTDLQAERGYSIEEQTSRISAYCQAKGWSLVKIYTDPGYSGKSLDRPAMQQLIADCTLYDIILVNKLDRLSRSQKDTLYLIEDVFRANGVQFASMSENFDTSTPLGMAMVGILSVFAQLEREQIKERMHMGRVGRVKKGLWHTSGKPPIGYDYIDGKLVVNEDEAEQIRLIYQKFISGQTMHSISVYMHNHYTNKYSSWNQTNSVSDVLRDPLYIGKVKFDGEYYDGIHEPIIDKETFDKAQKRYAITSRHHEQYINAFKSTHLLTGLIFCGECGNRFAISTCHVVCNKTTGEKRHYTYYGCRGRSGSNQNKMKANRCTNRRFKEKDLNEYIIDQIMNLRLSQIEKPPQPEEPDIEKKIKKIDAQISRLINLYSIDGISIDEVKEQIAKLNLQKEKLTKPRAKPDARLTPSEALTALATAKDVFSNGSIDEQRKLLSTLIKKIVLYKDHIDIQYNFNPQN